MSVEDELHWARGHLERLKPLMAGEQREHLVGTFNHLLLAVQELAARPLVEAVAAVKLEPGEVLFARVPPGTPPEVCARVSEDLRRLFPDNEARVDNLGLEFEVVAADG